MIEVKAEVEIVRDLVLSGSARETFFSGIAIEKTTAGERPIAKVRVVKCGIGSSGGESLSDVEGRFRMVRTPGECVLYAMAENGMAGFVPLSEKADEVKVVVSQSTSISGRVTDSDGKPMPGERVGVSLASGRSSFLKSISFATTSRTDENGRYMVTGAPVGSEGELSVFHQKVGSSTGPRTAVRFRVFDLAPVEVPDLVVPPVRPAK